MLKIMIIYVYYMQSTYLYEKIIIKILLKIKENYEFPINQKIYEK